MLKVWSDADYLFLTKRLSIKPALAKVWRLALIPHVYECALRSLNTVAALVRERNGGG